MGQACKVRKEPTPRLQGTLQQRKREKRNQGEPRKRGQEVGRKGATKTEGKKAAKIKGGQSGRISQKRLLQIIKALGSLGKQFLESEENKADS